MSLSSNMRAAAVSLLTGRGFQPLRHFYRMVIDLDGPPPEASPAN